MCKEKEEKCCRIINCNIVILSLLLFIILFWFIFVSMNPQNQKSILTAFAVEGDNTQVGITTIRYSRNEIVVGNALLHEEGSDSIQINETGIYQISYQLYGQRETFGTFNFNAVLVVNDTILDNTLNESPILRDNVINRMTLTSTVILSLNAGDTLKLQGISVEDIFYTRARIDIERIDS